MHRVDLLEFELLSSKGLNRTFELLLLVLILLLVLQDLCLHLLNDF